MLQINNLSRNDDRGLQAGNLPQHRNVSEVAHYSFNTA